MYFFRTLFTISLALPAVFLHAAPTTYNLNTTESAIKWEARKVAGPHNGTVQLKSGTLTIDQGEIKSGSFLIDFATITDLDLTNPEWKTKLETHLKSPDFFDVLGHPTGSFTFKSSSKGAKPGEWTITGDLTIKAKTKTINFPAQITVDPTTATAKADITINRLDFDIKYNSASFFDPKKLGDKLIYDDIKIALDLKANATVPVADAKSKAKESASKKPADKLKSRN